MYIAKLFFSLSAFLLSVSLMAQVKVNPDIQKKFDSFIELSNQKKWDQAFDLMYPKLFSKVPKQDLVDLMTSMDQDGLTLNMSNIKIESASAPFASGDESFIKIGYTADLSIQVAEDGLYGSPKAIQAMTEQFQTAYGKANVRYNNDSKKFSIAAHKSMMAIQSAHQWYIIEINTDQQELMEYLFPVAVMDALVRSE